MNRSPIYLRTVLFYSPQRFNFNMSSEIESPVSKYGRSSEFGGVLDFIQSMISNDTLRKSFDIPHLVMVGRQNMAKTTLINRLIGRYLLPMRRNETANTLQARTTYPIILNLRNGPKTIVEVRCDTCEGIGGEVENPTDDQVEDFLKQVAGHLPKEEGTPISKTPVNVTLQGMIMFDDGKKVTFNSVIRTTRLIFKVPCPRFVRTLYSVRDFLSIVSGTRQNTSCSNREFFFLA